MLTELTYPEFAISNPEN